MFFWDGSRWTMGKELAEGAWREYELEPADVGGSGAERHRSHRFATTGAACGIVALALVVIIAVVVVSSPPPAQRGLLKTSVAVGVYEDLTARLQRDVHSVAGIRDLLHFASPSAAQSIVAEASCGCLQTPTLPAPFELLAPVERSYPLSFLAETDEKLTQLQTGEVYPYVFLTVFQKASKTANWQLTYYLQYGSPTPVISPSGRIDTQGSASTFPSSWAFGQLATALTDARSRGQISQTNYWYPATFQPESILGNLFGSLTDDYRADVGFKGLNEQPPYTFKNHSIAFRFGETVIECGTIYGWGSLNEPGQVQPENRSTYGTLLAPGDYSTITTYATRQVCMQELLQSRLVQLLGINGGPWLMLGTSQGSPT
jgi:hypothetical protein